MAVKAGYLVAVRVQLAEVRSWLTEDKDRPSKSYHQFPVMNKARISLAM